jgi:hypothetical protein
MFRTSLCLDIVALADLWYIDQDAEGYGVLDQVEMGDAGGHHRRHSS